MVTIMNHAKLLDCTLRDGAYLIDKKFGDNTIRGIIDGLLKANIDYIEIGFFQNEGFGDGKTVYKNSVDAARFVPADKKNSMFTVLADFSRYSVENLDECTDESIDAIRECFFKKERFDAMEACRVIKNKGYKLFIQPVDILGYTDAELIEFIHMVNEVEPYCLSIVDTFGSMYQEDLHRIFEIIHHNLFPECKIGLHSHNNMQLSNALSQEFIRMTAGRRNVVVDGTISGMGRGAGNMPTELAAQYMCSQLGYNYDMDVLLDIIDSYMNNIRSRCEWGYSTPYFVAGCYSAHVNNITYLTKKNSIRSKDIRYILNKIGAEARKRYDYGLLERTYIELLNSEIDDNGSLDEIRDFIGNRPVLLTAPGSSVKAEQEKIKEYVKAHEPVIISANFIYDGIKPDYIYISNVKRYQYWKNSKEFAETKKIITSNIDDAVQDSKTLVVSFVRFLKCGWDHMDNSAVMLLRLLDHIGVSEIAIAGFDGYDYERGEKKNFASRDLEVQMPINERVKLNREISEMLTDFNNTRLNKDTKIRFITHSRFERCFE